MLSASRPYHVPCKLCRRPSDDGPGAPQKQLVALT
jgi:hypothetical protein